MTFDDDYVQLELPHGTVRATCRSLGLMWPPPMELDYHGTILCQVSRSGITDVQRKGMTHVMRGARYVRAELVESPSMMVH